MSMIRRVCSGYHAEERKNVLPTRFYEFPLSPDLLQPGEVICEIAHKYFSCQIEAVNNDRFPGFLP